LAREEMGKQQSLSSRKKLDTFFPGMVSKHLFAAMVLDNQNVGL
jgi:hypothetical protein